MSNGLREPAVELVPLPRFAITRWLLRPLESIGQEGDSELRQTLFRRLGPVLISAGMMSSTSVLVAVKHPYPVILAWVALDLFLSCARLPVVLQIIRLTRTPGQYDLPPELVDIFVLVGTLWSAVVGFGILACVSTGDAGVSMLASALALGTIGAQGVRSPGSPRLNIIQMCLVILPFMVGLLFSEVPLTKWIALLTPFYLLGMIGITLQLHRDYVQLIMSGIENRRRALHCSLTGLPNRAFFQERLAEELKTANGGTIIVLYLDLDGFKIVNDTLGHDAGDKLLQRVAERLLVWKLPGTVVARIGGDEFAIITRLEASKIESAVPVLISVLGQPYDLGAYGKAYVGVSAGIAISEPDGDFRTVTLRADQALYAAKKVGKGTYRWHPETLPEFKLPLTIES